MVEVSAKMDVHPVADLFPMLSDEELEELAEDIRERGLLFPIVLDKEGRVLDGRNRLRACELVGVAPEFSTYEGEDPDGYAYSVNINRRQLTDGQKAIVAAKRKRMIEENRPDLGGLGGRGKATSSLAADEYGINRNRVIEANVILDYADLVDAVMRDTTRLSAAYEDAKTRRRQAEEDEKLRVFVSRYPDLIDLWKDGRVSLKEAHNIAVSRDEEAAKEQAAEQERAREEEQERAARIRRNSNSFAEHMHYLVKVLPGVDITHWFDNELSGSPFTVTKDVIQEAAEVLRTVADQWED